MARPRASHLHGPRGQAFAERIRGVSLERILCVAIDISKDFHKVLIHNGLGEVMMPAFDIDIFQTGFDRLCRRIRQAERQTEADVVLVGMEPTGHYHENLAYHLSQQPWPLFLVNPYAVKENRNQQLLPRQKSDTIDAAAIGDLLRRGQGVPYQPMDELYRRLRTLDRQRWSEIRIQTMYKNRIIGHLDRLFPGLLLTKAGQSRYRALFTRPFWDCQTLQHLVEVCTDPHVLVEMTSQELIEAFHAHDHAMGPVTSKRILTYIQGLLLPDPTVVDLRQPLLARDQEALAQVTARVEQLEQEATALLAQTPYQVWTRIKGLTPVRVASLAAAIGDPDRYGRAASIFRRSGLVPSRNDSGSRQRQGEGAGIDGTGDRHLRRALMQVTCALIWHQPVIRDYFRRLSRHKPQSVARVACARRSIGILWAIQRDQASLTFDLNDDHKEETM